MTFQNRTIFITGASRGIGESIALKLAAAGANIVIAAKSVEEDPRLGGTIFSVAKAVEAAGGKALPVQVDIRDEAQIQQAVKQAAEKFGGIDVLINNASAIQLTNTEQTPAKRFDLIHDINVRGTFLMTQHCIPYLKAGNNPHILTLSPPINLDPKWMGGHIAYTISKYNMSMLALGWAAELKPYGIAANSLWPATTIATAAVKNLLGGDALMSVSRKPEIIADAVSYILSKPAATCTGNNFIDEAVLQAEGITDFEKYAVTPGGRLQSDLFL
ncbi:SDR family oxidoreductase [Chitinophaga nivalis]|uniref:NAD(P)-dependent oxidoreductase n=1 Tax=Chitinophaga nivalis TaxID=2991709 RepID=A0ABT3IT35_9BACT|nr:NAD(P)-dependent oxidoreductase [Chitinophaga nivalis]MCW3463172.1 NAD(P)-dependent oxidoreductase [Chitinophaga nivalis]MCW3487138.1 NAD(P)-dependent oxidoreductase [Chitinophaga nivalis]